MQHVLTKGSLMPNDNQKVLWAQGPRTKYFERSFLSFNKL